MLNDKLSYKLFISPNEIRTISHGEYKIHHVYCPSSEWTRAIKESGESIPDSNNPRSHEGKCLNGNIPKAIEETLVGSPELFPLINRGLTIIALNAAYNSEDNILTVDFGTKEEHRGSNAKFGVVDGATTSAIIQRAAELCIDETSGEIISGPDLDAAIVHLEIITGKKLDDRSGIISEIAVGRNSSRAVKPFSIENFKGSYSWLLESISDQPYYNKIGLEENAECDINILELTAILNLFNPYWTDMDRMPDSYTSKQSMVDRYQEMMEGTDKERRNNLFRTLVNIIPDILKLHDIVLTEFYDACKNATPPIHILKMGNRGKNGGKESSLFRKCKKNKLTVFTNQQKTCVVPTGVLFPLLGSLRALIGKNKDGSAKWNTDPFEFWDKHRIVLATQIMDKLSDWKDDPQTCGKKSSSYKHMYGQVQSMYAGEEIARLREQLKNK